MQEQIYFQPTEVPIGARVRFCIPGSDDPVDDVPPLTCLLGGVPNRPKLYDLTGDNPAIFNECANFVEGVRFVPADIYTAETAPEGTEFIIHSAGDWLNYEAYPRYRMLVTKLADGSFMSVCGYAYDHWLRRVDLPEDARLVSTGKCERTQTVDDATILFVEPYSKEWAALEEAGCTFHQVHFGDFADKHPYHVWMPEGWHMEETGRDFLSNDTGTKEYVIKDSEENAQAFAIFFKWNGQQAGGLRLP